MSNGIDFRISRPGPNALASGNLRGKRNCRQARGERLAALGGTIREHEGEFDERYVFDQEIVS